MTLRELVEYYIDGAILRPRTQKEYRDQVDRFINEIGRDPEIDEIDYAMCLQYRRAVCARATKTTFNTYRRHLALLMNYAVSLKLIGENPWSQVKALREGDRIRKAVPQKLVAHVISILQEQQKLVTKTDPRRFYPQWFWIAVIRTFHYTGMRVRQLVELEWRDIDFDSRTIMLRVEGSKTEREWRIPCDDRLRVELLALKEQAEMRGKASPTDQVFCYPAYTARVMRGATERMMDRHVFSFFTRISKELDEGVRVSAHRLRHSLATSLVRMGDIQSAQQILGHTDFRTTLSYVEPDIEAQASMIRRIKEI